MFGSPSGFGENGKMGQESAKTYQGCKNDTKGKTDPIIPAGFIKIRTGEIIPMLCPKCKREGINRISMSLYNANGFYCVCGFEVGY